MTAALTWFLLGLAILSEVVATSALKASDGMTRLAPGLVVVGGYAIAFWLLALTLRTLPVGFVYGVWAGLGVIGVAIVGALFFGETLGAIKIIGFVLIVTGVILIKAGSA
ncbi:DMT family transporter [Halofilum ochraceum]|uniref:DMT family transporter n=1 Tax=Halofilum ochraceum TaxID=1611323 RepID=UPI0008D94DCB|nr:multidrug efflux SMR transporter [Halofilum ochraceum]